MQDSNDRTERKLSQINTPLRTKLSLRKNKKKSTKNQTLSIYAPTLYSSFYVKEIVCVCLFTSFLSNIHLPNIHLFKPCRCKTDFMTIFSCSIHLRWFQSGWSFPPPSPSCHLHMKALVFKSGKWRDCEVKDHLFNVMMIQRGDTFWARLCQNNNEWREAEEWWSYVPVM